MHLNKLSGVGTLKLRVEAEDLIERIKLSIADFSSVLIGSELEHIPHDEHAELINPVTAVLCFDGACSGIIWARCSEPFASFLAGRFRGCEEDSLLDHAGDAVTEIVHILGSEIRLFFSPMNKKFKLSEPEVFIGSAEGCESLINSDKRVCCTFRYGRQRLQVGVVLQ